MTVAEFTVLPANQRTVRPHIAGCPFNTSSKALPKNASPETKAARGSGSPPGLNDEE
jgi:hypothetical protein